MPRRFRGVICQEGVQTGDGRVIAEGALTWAELPLPLAWLRDGDQHVMSEVAPQIGIIESITRSGSDIIGEGFIDDANPDGAEVIRRMEAGAAPGGARFFVSIDADDYEVEIIITEPMEEDGLMLIASGAGPWRPLGQTIGIRAAAGDPDPGPGGGPDGELLFEAAADEILERATQLRIRGATLCSVPAFDGAFIELVQESDTPPGTEPVAASLRVVTAHAPAAPPEDFFSDPVLPDLERWVTVDESTGRVFGHLAGWGECHIGIPGRCITPEALAAGGFDYFRHGHVVAASGARVATGPVALTGGHADPRWDWRRAQAHYDDPETAVMDVSVGTDDHGVWFAGVVRPGASAEKVYAIRASGVSGDWRLIGGELRLVGVCSVNTPGFPKARAHVSASGQVTALVAAGGRPMSAWEHRPCPSCAASDTEALERRLARVEAATADTILASLDARVGRA